MRKTWTKEKIKEMLLEEYKKNNNLTLSSTEIEKNKNLPSRVTIYEFFGKSLNKVWKEIEKDTGIKLNFRKNKISPQAISKELIIERIHSLHKKLGRVPTYNEYKKEYGFNQIPHKFGGYCGLLEAANLGYTWGGKISKRKLINYLQKNIDNGKIKSIRDLRLKKEFPDVPTIYRILECNSLEEVNRIINRNIFFKIIRKSRVKSIKNKSNEELLKEYRLLSQNLKRENGATGNDIEKYLMYSSKSFIFRFNGLEKLRKLAGYDYKQKYSKWNKEKIKERLLVEYRKNNNKRLKIREIELNENLPSITTIRRYFNKNLEGIWKEVLKYQEGVKL